MLHWENDSIEINLGNLRCNELCPRLVIQYIVLIGCSSENMNQIASSLKYYSITNYNWMLYSIFEILIYLRLMQ